MDEDTPHPIKTDVENDNTNQRYELIIDGGSVLCLKSFKNRIHKFNIMLNRD